MRLFIGDDWAEDHHDVELMGASGGRLAKARLPEGVAGMARLHAMAGEALGDDAEDGDPGQVVVGTETDRGPWVAALIAAGYTVYAINPLQASQYRKRHGVSGAKSTSPGARAYYDQLRGRGVGHYAALRQLANPPGRHPAWLPQDPHPLRRGHRLAATHGGGRKGCSLTFKPMGCLSSHTTARTRQAGTSLISQAASGRQADTEPAHRTSERYGQDRSACTILQ